MPRTEAEIEKILESHPQLTQLSCADLCGEQANDFDLLDDLDEIPVKFRAQARAAISRSIQAIRFQLKQQKCPPCTD